MKKVTIFLSAVVLFPLIAFASEPTITSDIHFSNVFYNAKSLPQGVSGAYTFEGNQTPQVAALIAWDLNGVIFEKRYSLKGMLEQTAVTKKYGFFKTATLLKDFLKLYQQKRTFKNAQDPRGYVWDAMFTHLEHNPVKQSSVLSNKELADLLREFSQEANHLDFQLIQLLEKLEQHGHKNVVLSNMGQGLVDLQVVNLQKQLAALTEADAHKKKDLSFAITFLTQPTNIIASEKNGWLHKPDRLIYHRCLENNNIEASGKKVLKIFIDDKQENIDAALADGLFDIGINYKNVQDLSRIFYYIFPHFVQSSGSRKTQNHIQEF